MLNVLGGDLVIEVVDSDVQSGPGGRAGIHVVYADDVVHCLYV